MSKSQKDKSAWDWIDNLSDPNHITQQHLEKVYHLNLELCQSKAKKNCQNNPRCIHGLGEKALYSNDDSEKWKEENDWEEAKRDTFVGLKNLGATCYVNSLLQVWYQNLVLRKALYQWVPEEDPIEVSSLTEKLLIDDSGDHNGPKVYQPKTPVGHLQLIFAKMQFCKSKVIDPSPFVKSLCLNESQQQDADEFCNLFMSHLEMKFAQQKNPSIKTIIQDEYSGKYAYVTKCDFCKNGSYNQEPFYKLELNIKGCKNIYDCLNEFFKEEKLEGSNQYDCFTCQKKQNATRSIKLVSLPPILNLQLLRFVFQNGYRKKLNTMLSFPDKLDMKPYFSDDLNCDKNQTTYCLSAVLIHRGPSAHSGHYIAHVKDKASGCWYKFNDETVEKIDGQKLKLEPEDENLNGNGDAATEKEIQPKETKDWHKTNNAYMLVYETEQHAQTELSLNSDWQIQEYLRSIIDKENNIFEERLQEKQQKLELFISESTKAKNEIKEIYETLPCHSNDDYELISKQWLIDWLRNFQSETLSHIDNSTIMCVHDKVDFNKIFNTKCISSKGADKLYSKYQGGPRLTKNSLCEKCVESEFNLCHLKKQIDEHQKFITSQLKFTAEANEKSYWISKKSLRNWKSIAVRNKEKNDDSIITFDGDGDYLNGEETFNQDIICEHGELTPDDSLKRLITERIWNILKYYFPDAKDFEQDYPKCEGCLSIQSQLKLVKDENRNKAANEKNILTDLCHERRRLSWNNLDYGSTYYVLSRKFLTAWQSFISNPTKNDPPSKIENSGLLCAEHNGFLYPPKETELIGESSRFLIISSFEWEQLIHNYKFDSTIKIFLIENGVDKTVLTEPPFCNSCNENLAIQEMNKRLTYQDQYVYVYYVKQEKSQESNDTTTDPKQEDADVYEISLPKRQKKFDSDTLATLGFSPDQRLRRSSRRKKNKNEKQVKVSSTDKLKDLKVKIMDIFGVVTLDQRLSLDGVQLEGNDKTLTDLKIVPNSTIILTVDEETTSELTIIEDDYIKGSTPEVGFKGTQLQN